MIRLKQVSLCKKQCKTTLFQPIGGKKFYAESAISLYKEFMGN